MAITHDANSEGNIGSGTTLTVAHTCAGTLRILWAMVFTTGNDNVSGVTYNGVAMTQAVKKTSASSQTVYLYYLIAPATGTHDIVASVSGASNITIVGMSFNGAKQSGVPDAFGSDNNSGGSASVALTTIADNCFAVMGVRFNSGTPSAGTGMTLAGGLTMPGTGLYTTAAKTPAGALTLSENNTGSFIWAAVGASFAPSVAEAPTVDTAAATSIADVSATLNGEITAEGTSTPDERGFVWGTTSHGDPGDVAPVSAGYDDFETESGTFGTGIFDYPLSGLTPLTAYYVRAYAHSSDGYAYGPQITFTTLDVPPFRFTNIPGVVFDPDDTQTLFAERLNDMLDRLDAGGL